MPDRAPEPEERHMTGPEAVEELTDLFRQVGRLEATAVLSHSSDVLGPLAAKATAALLSFIERVEAMPAGSAMLPEPESEEDKRKGLLKKAKAKKDAAEEEARRKTWILEAQLLRAQVELIQHGPDEPVDEQAEEAVALRIGRGAAGDKPTSNELVSSAAVRELFAAPPNGEVVLAGKTLTDPALLEAMSAGLDGNVTSLESMVLARCELGDVAMEELSHALQEHPTLVALDLSDNGIGQAGAEAILAQVIAPEETGKKRRGASRTLAKLR